MASRAALTKCHSECSCRGRVFGRVELVEGTLGSGKTTWAALRARQLAEASGRSLATTGEGWPEPWQAIASLEDLDRVRGAVIVMDECHMWSPSARGMLPKEYEMELLRVLSMLRKRHCDWIGTTQALTRVSTHVRQQMNSYWKASPVIPGRLHRARWFTSPLDGGDPIGFAKTYRPARAAIPTDAGVFLPPQLFEGRARSGGGAGRPFSSTRAAK